MRGGNQRTSGWCSRVFAIAIGSWLLLSGSSAGAASLWGGWAPESIASPDAKATLANVNVATGTAPDGSPVVAWLDNDGAVEAAVRDVGGHWSTTIVGRSPITLTTNSKGDSVTIAAAPTVSSSPDGATVVAWSVCPAPAATCQPEDRPTTWSAVRLASDGSWLPEPAPLPLPPWSPTGSLGDGGPAGIYWQARTNDAHDAIAIGSSVSPVRSSIEVSRAPRDGAWSAPEPIELPRSCRASLGWDFPDAGLPALDAGGAGAAVAYCAIDVGTGELRNDGKPVAILFPRAGGVIAREIPSARSRHIGVSAWAFTDGGLILAIGDGAIQPFGWTSDGALGGPEATFPRPAATATGGAATFGTAPDGRAALAYGVDDFSAFAATVREPSGTWSTPSSVGMPVVAIVVGAGPPAFLAWGRQLTSGAAVGGFSLVALGTDAAPPALATPPSIHAGVVRVGKLVRIAGVGRWRGAPVPRLRWTWRRCRGRVCTPIAGAHARTYRAMRRDLGYRLQIRVRAVNASGTDSALATTGVVRNG